MAGNKWLAMAIGDLRKILKLARLHQLNAPGRLEQSLKEHLRIFAALQSRDPPAAQEAMHDHLMKQREALRHLKSQASRMPVRRRSSNATQNQTP
jgi:DNA-binding FadR family transcriptional regulator